MTQRFVFWLSTLLTMTTFNAFSQGAFAAEKQGVCFVLYTVQDSTLKLTAQLYPLEDNESREVLLQVSENDRWSTVAKTRVRENLYSFPEGARSWTAHFRVESWDHDVDHPYRVVALDGASSYQGLIRRDPIEKAEIVVAAFTGNSNADKRLKPDLVHNVKAANADLLFFSGDQVYTHRDHLGDWLRFGEQFGELTRDRPTITIPDDHDVGQGNLWGAGGRATKKDRAGGYEMPASHVIEVEWAQTSHLPDPFDPTPVEQGIGVYYTRLNVGRIDFAIIEDRKFKSGPDSLLPKGLAKDDLDAWDVDGAVLLGQRQLRFLNQWGEDWRGTDMKCVLSQTVFAGPHTNKNVNQPTPPSTDTDTNGWPRAGRNRALAAMRKGAAFHICGDQHLATVIHHGIDDWDDAGYSFCVQSIVNFFPRHWLPSTDAVKRIESSLPYAGSFYDGFGNRMTLHAYANPEFGIKNYSYQVDENAPLRGADGFGLVRFNKNTRKITVDCWPRLVDITKQDAKQYEGWPITIDQWENDGRKAIAWLPEINVTGKQNPIVQVVEERTNEVLYTRRIQGTQYRPKVFAEGSYTLRVGEQPDEMKSLTGLTASSDQDERKIQFDF
ncbi:alkaline phosphatase D family protein [Novipirellula artificiosorum]|uniref:PhoD-like phosphatase n=1 Tax=Novipirellula artificiosorum TaxID=2528016 RepID=A0A5C6D3X1_9BACT|nr:alkaline phosphatase D family protein [Novipirellula artificiosorum]TWU30574.1 PhoD-like phosphatase [Novipirellula artificiosorum]